MRRWVLAAFAGGLALAMLAAGPVPKRWSLELDLSRLSLELSVAVAGAGLPLALEEAWR